MAKSLKKLRSDGKQFILPLRTLQKLPKNKTYKLLDIGADDNYIRSFLPENIKYYSLDYQGDQDYIHNLDNFPIPIGNGQFDIILCLETLEHTLYPHKIMQEIVRIAKPNALFLLSMPNEYNFYCRLNFLLARKTTVQEPFQVIEKHHHIQVPRVKDILKFFSQHIDIGEIGYGWYSRTAAHNPGLKGKISINIDKLINKLAPISPNLFSRTVVVRGTNKKPKSPKLL